MAARQPVHDIVGDAVAEILLAGAASEVTKRQDRDAGALAPRQVGLRTGREAATALTRHDAVDVDRPTDVLQLALAEVGELDRHLVPHISMHRPGDDDLTRSGHLMDARGDVDAVPDKLVLVDDDVLDVDSDPQ